MFFTRPPDPMKYLRDIYHQVRKEGAGQHFAGFAILCKDLAEFLAARGYDNEGIRLFRDAYNRALEADRFYWEAFFPDALANLPGIEHMPHGLVNNANNGKFDLKPITKEKICTEWTRFLGWAFFREWSMAIQDYVKEALEEDIPDEFQSKKEEVIELARRLLGLAVGQELFWYPMAFIFGHSALYDRFRHFRRRNSCEPNLNPEFNFR